MTNRYVYLRVVVFGNFTLYQRCRATFLAVFVGPVGLPSLRLLSPWVPLHCVAQACPCCPSGGFVRLRLSNVQIEAALSLCQHGAAAAADCSPPYGRYDLGCLLGLSHGAGPSAQLKEKRVAVKTAAAAATPARSRGSGDVNVPMTTAWVASWR